MEWLVLLLCCCCNFSPYFPHGWSLLGGRLGVSLDPLVLDVRRQPWKGDDKSLKSLTAANVINKCLDYFMTATQLKEKNNNIKALIWGHKKALKGTILIKENKWCQNHVAADVTGQEGKDRGPRFRQLCICLAFPRVVLFWLCTVLPLISWVTWPSPPMTSCTQSK